MLQEQRGQDQHDAEHDDVGTGRHAAELRAQPAFQGNDQQLAQQRAAVGEQPVYVWSGAYAGGFVGYSTANFDGAVGADANGDGVVGGAYGGYNLQSGPLVYGIEGDAGYSGVTGDDFSATLSAPVSTDSGGVGSVRGRIGVSQDPFLLFATGGVAVAEKELALNGVSDDNTHVGFTVGAGVEAKITDTITSRLEYRYSDFDDQTYDFGATSTSAGFDEHSVRAGLALKF